METKWKGKILIGKNEGRNIYISAPKWDCDWYWSFGYLGNKDCHYHLNGLNKYKNLYDSIKEHFGNTFIINKEDDLWLFCELSESIYHLKNTSEFLMRGNSYISHNPHADIIKNVDEAERINKGVLPVLFESVYHLLKKYEVS